jgi:hypothetical protein
MKKIILIFGIVCVSLVIALGAAISSQAPVSGSAPRYQIIAAPFSKVAAENRANTQDSDVYRLDTFTGRTWKLSVNKDRWHPVLERGEILESDPSR